MDLVYNQVFKLAALTRLTAAGGPLNGALMALGQADIVPTEATPLASYTVATYTGYAPAAITWLAASVSDAGVPEIVGTVPEFRPTDAVTPNQIYTAQITNAAGTVLEAAGRFDSPPAPMVSALDSIILTPRVRLTPSGYVVQVT